MVAKQKTKANPSARSAADWEAIEQDYRAGLKSLREIAAEHGITHAAIRKRAAKEGWDRDLSAKIKARAEALVSKEQVSSEVSAETAISDRAIIEANAEVIKQIRLAHRKDIARARKHAMRLLDELEHTGESIDLIEQLEGLVAAETQDEKLSEKRAIALQKVLELPTRTQTMKALAETMTKLIALEREAYSLETKPQGGGDAGASEQLLNLLNTIDGAGTGLPSHAGPAR